MSQIYKQYLPYEDQEGCCNFHDLCYDTCHVYDTLNQTLCDLNFKDCLNQICTAKEWRWSFLCPFSFLLSTDYWNENCEESLRIDREKSIKISFLFLKKRTVFNVRVCIILQSVMQQLKFFTTSSTALVQALMQMRKNKLAYAFQMKKSDCQYLASFWAVSSSRCFFQHFFSYYVNEALQLCDLNYCFLLKCII